MNVTCRLCRDFSFPEGHGTGVQSSFPSNTVHASTRAMFVFKEMTSFKIYKRTPWILPDGTFT